MQYDSTLKRGLTLVDMAGIVAKLGIDVDEKGLRGLFALIDMNRNGVIEFDELSYVIIDDVYKWNLQVNYEDKWLLFQNDWIILRKLKSRFLLNIK